MSLSGFVEALSTRGSDRIETGLRDRRARLLATLAGDVLELGAGRGTNLEHYAAGVRLVLVEPDPVARLRLEGRLAASGRDAEIVDATAEDLPFPDASFDAVVTTLVLCSVRDLAAALAEIHRILRPGGRLALIEHVRGTGGRAALQEAIAPVSRLLLSCAPNRRTAEAVRAAGFELAEEPFTLAGSPPWTRPAVSGLAVKAS